MSQREVVSRKVYSPAVEGWLDERGELHTRVIPEPIEDELALREGALLHPITSLGAGLLAPSSNPSLGPVKDGINVLGAVSDGSTTSVTINGMPVSPIHFWGYGWNYGSRK